MGKQNVYHKRTAKELSEACPDLPATTLDLVMNYLAETQTNYSVYASSPLQLAEFDFLYNKLRVATKFVPFQTRTLIATVPTASALTTLVSKADIESYLKISKASLVGKNDKTVLDKTVRNSNEILADQIQMNPAFFARLSGEIQKLAKKLGHPTKVKANLYKLVIYQKGDFFETHIDSPHGNAEPMIFTASVQLSLSQLIQSSGGELVVGDTVIPCAKDGQMGITLFYHDEPHRVKLLQDGFRVSLIFDVLDTGIPVSEATPPTVAATTSTATAPNDTTAANANDAAATNDTAANSTAAADRDASTIATKSGMTAAAAAAAASASPMSASEAISMMIAKGFENVAIRTSHSYMSILDTMENCEKRIVTPDQLKGTDKVFYELMQSQGATSIEICEVFEEDGRLMRRELLNVFGLNPAFDSLYEVNDEQEGDEEDEEKEVEEKEEEEAPKKRKKTSNGSNDNKRARVDAKLQRAKEEYDKQEVTPNYDEEGRGVAIKRKYRLGNTLFLATVTPRILAFRSDEEVHLGNHGFYGKIFSNLAIIAHF